MKSDILLLFTSWLWKNSNMLSMYLHSTDDNHIPSLVAEKVTPRITISTVVVKTSKYCTKLWNTPGLGFTNPTLTIVSPRESK
jgi:hypothetical protein